MITPTDLNSLALRIERLRAARTRDWNPGDELEHRNLMPGGRDRRALPEPASLRAMASSGDRPPFEQWRVWIAMAAHLETLAHRNNPRNPQKAIRDMMRGKPPFGH